MYPTMLIPDSGLRPSLFSLSLNLILYNTSFPIPVYEATRLYGYCRIGAEANPTQSI